MPPQELLTVRAAARARQLELFARQRVEGFLKGANASKLKGQSTDFLSHRAYQHGDDLRHLDWRVLARSDRLVTRQYEEYTNFDALLVIDASGSMGYAGQGMSKLDFVRHCAAMLFYLLNRQRDRFGLAALSDTVVNYLRPASGQRHLAETFRRLGDIEPAGETDFAAGMKQLTGQLRRKGVVVVFSDCYQEPESMTKAVGSLALRGHDVVLYQVVDRAELDLEFSGFTQFRDLETGAIDAADPLAIRDAYRDVVQAHGIALQQGAARLGLEFHTVHVTDDWDDVLADLLHLRMARR